MESGRTAVGGAYKSWELFTRISFIRLLFPSPLSLISLPHNWNERGGAAVEQIFFLFIRLDFIPTVHGVEAGSGVKLVNEDERLGRIDRVVCLT